MKSNEQLEKKQKKSKQKIDKKTPMTQNESSLY